MTRNLARVRPFSQGTQYLDWQDHNCCQCRYYHTANGHVISPLCDLETALAIACITDGTISREIAERLGVPKRTWSNWTCREFELGLGGESNLDREVAEHIEQTRREPLPGQKPLPLEGWPCRRCGQPCEPGITLCYDCQEGVEP